jgi:Flp pilus assembly protein TadB
MTAGLANLYAFIRSPWGLRLVLALVVLMVIGGAFLSGRHSQREADKAAERTAVAKAEVKDAHADAKADVQRATDQQTVSDHQKELQGADDASPDTRPSAARLALACARLHAQSPGAKLPACP